MRVIRTIIFILVCLGLIWLIVLLFSRVFSTSTEMQVPATNLSTHARAGTTASLTIDGPIVVNQEHKTIRIAVDSNQSTIELISGYDGSVIRQDSFANTPEGFTVFLRALDTLGFSKGDSAASQDERGQCPLQNRYVYKLNDGSKDIVHFWSTSCGTGTFGGSRESVRALFQRQLPAQTYNSYSNDLTRS